MCKQQSIFTVVFSGDLNRIICQILTPQKDQTIMLLMEFDLLSYHNS